MTPRTALLSSLFAVLVSPSWAAKGTLSEIAPSSHAEVTALRSRAIAAQQLADAAVTPNSAISNLLRPDAEITPALLDDLALQAPIVASALVDPTFRDMHEDSLELVLGEELANAIAVNGRVIQDHHNSTILAKAAEIQDKIGLRAFMDLHAVVAKLGIFDGAHRTQTRMANIPSRALPYIEKFYGKTVVIKFGGNAMTDEKLKHGFASDVILLRSVGMRPVVVHGGGPQIDQVLERMGKESSFMQGMRVTDDETMQAVEEALNLINGDIFCLVLQAGGFPVSVFGHKPPVVRGTKLLLLGKDSTKKIDLGRVGEVTSIDVNAIRLMQQQGSIPVIAPIGIDEKNQTLNINADLVAGAIARALNAEKLVMLTNTLGVLDRHGNLLTELTPSKIKALIAEGTLSGGMLPKIGATLEAALSGVRSVHIIDGRVMHAVRREIFTDEGVGTVIRQE